MALLGDPTNTGEWAQSFLSLLGDPLTTSNIDYVEAWEAAESPTGYGYNPLGTEETEPGSQVVPQDVGTGYSVQAFKSLSSGLLASVATVLGNPANSKLIAALKTGSSTTAELSKAQSAPGASWATGNEPDITQSSTGYGVSTAFTYGGKLGETPGAAPTAGVVTGVGPINLAYTNPAGAVISVVGDATGAVTKSLASSIFGPLFGWVEEGAADITFVGFGLLLILIGLAITFKGEEGAAPDAAAAAVA